MKKNKYRWRTTIEDPVPFEVSIELREIGKNELIKGIITESTILNGNFEWRPIKTKLNKYRWREMKDEKPEHTEPIFFKRRYAHYPLSGFFAE